MNSSIMYFEFNSVVNSYPTSTNDIDSNRCCVIQFLNLVFARFNLENDPL